MSFPAGQTGSFGHTSAAAPTFRVSPPLPSPPSSPTPRPSAHPSVRDGGGGMGAADSRRRRLAHAPPHSWGVPPLDFHTDEAPPPPALPHKHALSYTRTHTDTRANTYTGEHTHRYSHMCAHKDTHPHTINAGSFRTAILLRHHHHNHYYSHS